MLGHDDIAGQIEAIFLAHWFEGVLEERAKPDLFVGTGGADGN